MKTILCYGDSNTWGTNPATKARYESNERWPGVLRNNLGEGFFVIEEGLGGRTTVWEDPIEGHKNGKKYLIPCLDTHKPINLVVIMLGTNDLKHRFSLTAFDISKGAGVLVEIVLQSKTGPQGKSPQVLLLAPPPIAKLTGFADMFKGAQEKSQQLGKFYRQVAAESCCFFLDTSEIIRSSDLDGIHLEKNEHQKLGTAVANKVRQILNA
jgi:lysophospholipase L1-like esterase